MRRTMMVVFGVMVLVLVGLLLRGLPVAAQQTEAGYTIDWWTVDGGGATFLTGNGYSLGGTAGQPDAGALTGSGYTLGGGFWKGGASPLLYRIYLPIVMKGG